MLDKGEGELEPYFFTMQVKKTVPLKYKYNIDKVSICVPFDVSGNRFSDGVSVGKLPSAIQIVLMDDKGDIMYDQHPLAPNEVTVYDVASMVLFLGKLAHYKDRN